MIRVGVLLAAAALQLWGVPAASAQGPSPYDMTYEIRGGGETPLYAGMAESAARVGMIPAGAGGIVLRWCRDEIPFGSWQFGSRRDQLKLLDGRWCEVSHKGRVGNLPGKVLSPE